MLTTAVRNCDVTSRRRTGVQHGGAQFRLAEHAVDRSYGRMFLSESSCNVTIEFGGGDNLLILITPAAAAAAPSYRKEAPRPSAGCSRHAIVAAGTEAWFRKSQITTPQPDRLVFDSVGLRSSTVHATAPSNSSLEASLPTMVTSLPHIAVGLATATTSAPGDAAAASTPLPSSVSSFGLSTAGPHTVTEITALVAAAREAELARYAKYKDLAETKKVVQAAVMWTSIYNPVESGPFANIIRGNPFSLDVGAVTQDWEYV